MIKVCVKNFMMKIRLARNDYMKKIYYYANQIYQFSYALPIYEELGGIFIVKDIKRFIQFKQYLMNRGKFQENTFLKTPKVLIKSQKRLHNLTGIILYLSNSIIPEHDYPRAITIFHEHGTSDKKYGGAKTNNIADLKLKKYDHIFLSGPKNLKRLEEIGLNFSPEKLVKIGALKFDKYLNNQFSREDEIKRLQIKDTTRKNILYAPTWRFGNGTLRKYGLKFAREITKKYNLIIRPHFHDNKFCQQLRSQAKSEKIDHLYFSNAANIIKHDAFNDFILADLMISDISSVIYEFLITAKPMIIIKNDFADVHEMPKNLDIRQNVEFFEGKQNIVKMIEHNLENSKYNETYKKMVKECFYTDGSSVQRAVEFIKKIRK